MKYELSMALIMLCVCCSCKTTQRRTITVGELNAGNATLIGELGYAPGTFHTVDAEFAMVTAHGRAGQGGDLLLKILSIDSQPVSKPLYFRYFKSVTLQPYLLPDGTDIFPGPANTHALQGKKITCTVYEDIILLDKGDDVLIFTNASSRPSKGFLRPWYQTSLGIVWIECPKESSLDEAPSVQKR